MYFPGTCTRMRNGAYPGSTQKTFNGGDDRISSFPLACTLIFPTIMCYVLICIGKGDSGSGQGEQGQKILTSETSSSFSAESSIVTS